MYSASAAYSRLFIIIVILIVQEGHLAGYPLDIFLQYIQSFLAAVSAGRQIVRQNRNLLRKAVQIFS